jgi:RNA polymerase sigma-70 factor (ECF subfamily)
MTAAGTPDTEQLLTQAKTGDRAAVNELMTRHRKRLRRMVAVRMDSRLARRVDPSDVVQDTLAEAAVKLPDYLQNRPIPFYPWLRQLAWNRLTDLYRFHVMGARRSLDREAEAESALSDASVVELAQRFAASGTSPSGDLLRRELRERVRSALEQLPTTFRELLVMRHLEQLSVREIAAITGMPEGTVKSRLARGVLLLQELLSGESLGGNG